MMMMTVRRTTRERDDVREVHPIDEGPNVPRVDYYNTESTNHKDIDFKFVRPLNKEKKCFQKFKQRVAVHAQQLVIHADEEVLLIR